MNKIELDKTLKVSSESSASQMIVVKLFLVFIFFSSSFHVLKAQRYPDAESQFMTLADSGMRYFYFDSFYYLNEKDCPYVQIIRKSTFDFENQCFSGSFVDQDRSGRKLLEGYYLDGQKNGKFTAYHTSGHLKWTGSYEEDIAVGEWKFFYPDGLPMIVMQIREDGFFIQDFYNTKGVQRVKAGQGVYEMKIEVKNFNDYGAQFIYKRGRIGKGKPFGVWEISTVSENGRKEFLASDQYLNGRMVSSIALEDIELFGEARTALLPISWFLNAENLLYKECTIDEQSGYLDYLSQRLLIAMESIGTRVIEPQWFDFQLKIDREGMPQEVNVQQQQQDAELARVLLAAIREVPYWIPSYYGDSFIQDLLTVRILAGTNTETGKQTVYDLQIDREKGI